jgi:hypothetical protein
LKREIGIVDDGKEIRVVEIPNIVKKFTKEIHNQD